MAEAEQAVQLAHDQMQQADQKKQEAKARLDALEEEAALARGQQQQVSPGDMQALWGLFSQLRALPTARAENFSSSWASTMQQLQAVEDMFTKEEGQARPNPRERWGDSCPMDDPVLVDTDSDVDPPELEQPAADRGQAARQGAAAGPWKQPQPRLVRELAAAAADGRPPAARTRSRSAGVGGGVQPRV